MNKKHISKQMPSAIGCALFWCCIWCFPAFTQEEKSFRFVPRGPIAPGSPVNTPMGRAICAGDTNAIQQLITNDRKLLDTLIDKEPPVHLAIFMHQEPTAQWLVSIGADVNKGDAYGETPLMQSASYGDVTMCEFLLKHGASLEQADKNGLRAMHRAATSDSNVKVVAVLLAKKAMVDCQSKYGSTPLTVAAENGNLRMIEFLVEKGAALEPKVKTGATPLHWAAGRGKIKAVELLIKLGANVNAKTSDGHTPLRVAEKSDYPEVAEILRKAGGKR